MLIVNILFDFNGFHLGKTLKSANFEILKNLKQLTMKKLLLLFVSIFISSILFSQECVTIFISEYVEGWSNNKAIELYNPTDESIDLSDYRLERFSNGSSSSAANQKLVLSGIMPPLSVYVIVIDQRDTSGSGQTAPVWDELQAKADIFMCPVYDDNNVMYFNGNDALVLFNTESGGAGFIWDVFGVVGQNPGDPSSEGGGWNNVPPEFTVVANGSEAWTTDHSLIRKPEVVAGLFSAPNVGEWDVSVQWDSIPPVLRNDDGIVIGGNWASLGNHSCNCGDVVDGISTVDFIKFDIYPNPADNELKINSEVPISDVDIYTINGKYIHSVSDLKQNEVILNIEDWEKGIYLVNLRFENNVVVTKKIIKQ